MREATRTAEPQQKITIISDGNPSYPDGIHFLNAKRPKELPRIEHRQVIGLQNLDEESTLFRPFKQLIERLNRTFKFHVRPSCGFKSNNGAIALTTLVVTHYNFLRPHMSLDYQTPIDIPELKNISTIQGQWIKILSMAV
jgi:transposase-like protein